MVVAEEKVLEEEKWPVGRIPTGLGTSVTGLVLARGAFKRQGGSIEDRL